MVRQLTTIFTRTAAARILNVAISTIREVKGAFNCLLVVFYGRRAQFVSAKAFEADAVALRSVGVSAQQIIPTLKVIGDTASGSGKPLSQIIALYGQIKSAGRANTEDLNQFTGAGIPILQLLATQYGKTTAEVRKMAGENKISYGDIQKALVSLTSEGGAFFDLMDKKSDSTVGKISTLQSSFTNMANALFEAAAPAISATLDELLKLSAGALDFIRNNQEMVTQIGLGAAAFAGLVAVASTLAAGMAFLSTVVGGALVSAFVAVLGPVIAIAAAIAALTVAYQQNLGGIADLINSGIKDLYAACGDLIRALQLLWNQVSPILIPAFKALASLLSTIVGFAFKALVDDIARAIKVLAEFTNFLTQNASLAFINIKQAIDQTRAALTLLFNVMSGAPPTDALEIYKQSIRDIGNEADRSRQKLLGLYNTKPGDFIGPPNPSDGAATGDAAGAALAKKPAQLEIDNTRPDAGGNDKEAKRKAKEALEAAKAAIEQESALRQSAQQARIDGLKRTLQIEESENLGSATKTKARLVKAEQDLIAIKLDAVRKEIALKGLSTSESNSLRLKEIQLEREGQKIGLDAAAKTALEKIAIDKATAESKQNERLRNAQSVMDQNNQEIAEAKALEREILDVQIEAVTQSTDEKLQIELKYLLDRRAAIKGNREQEVLFDDQIAAKKIQIAKNLSDGEFKIFQNDLTNNLKLGQEKIDNEKALADQQLQADIALENTRSSFEIQSNLSSIERQKRQNLKKIELEQKYLEERLALLKQNGLEETEAYRQIQQAIILLTGQRANIVKQADKDENEAKIQDAFTAASAVADFFGAAAKATGSSALDAAEVTLKSLIAIAEAAVALQSFANPIAAITSYARLGVAIAQAASAISGLSSARSQLGGSGLGGSGGGLSSGGSPGGGGLSSGSLSLGGSNNGGFATVGGTTIQGFTINYTYQANAKNTAPARSQQDTILLAQQLTPYIIREINRSSGSNTSVGLKG